MSGAQSLLISSRQPLDAAMPSLPYHPALAGAGGPQTPALPLPEAAAPPPPSDLGSYSSDAELESYSSAEDSAFEVEELLEPEQPGQQAAPMLEAAAGAEPGPGSRAARPSRAALRSCPDFPVMVTAEALPGASTSGADPSGALPVNTGRPIPFESQQFKGQAAIYIAGLPSAPAGLFKGQKRRTLVVVQGQFTDSVGFDDLVTGQEFARAKNLPPAWLMDGMLLKVARAVSPSMVVGPAKTPFMLMPAVAGANMIHVALPGQEPALTEEPREDMRLADPRLVAKDGAPASFSKRRALFSDPANRAGRAFDPSLVWTFYFFQHFVDISRYHLAVTGFYRFHLDKYLDGQPLQFMLKDRRRGAYLYRWHMWHEALLADAERHEAQRAQRA